jgi:hypothetical protein
MTPFLESHQTFFAQIAGFFIIEDRILRTGGGLVSRTDVDSLWDVAVAKMVSVLEDQFSRMQTANHLLLIKDYVGLLGMQHYCTVVYCFITAPSVLTKIIFGLANCITSGVIMMLYDSNIYYLSLLYNFCCMVLIIAHPGLGYSLR